MQLYLDNDHTQHRNIGTIVDLLRNGGVIIYPTDTLYALGCDIFHTKAIEKISRIKNIIPSKAKFSFVCSDLADLSRYTKSISTPLYRLLKSSLPGPYTFILPASREVPKILKSKKDTIGIRVPDNKIALSIVKELGHPIISTSLPGNSVEEYTDPEIIHRNFEDIVDVVVNGGPGGIIPSTVIDCTGPEPEIIRMGLGEWVTE